MNKYIALSGDLIFYKYIIDYQPSNIINIYSKSTFFVYPPERGEIGQSLPRLAHFHLKTSLDRWQLIK